MTIAAAIISELIEQNIDTVFGLPGIGTLSLNKCISDREDIQFIMARHETAVSHQAWGYGQSSGKIAATMVVPGPGDMNAMNGLKNALNDGTPIIHITAETASKIRGGEGIHEAPPDTYDNVVKHNKLVQTPEATIAELRKAISIAKTPPEGPVRIGIPKDFLSMEKPLADTGNYSSNAFDSLPEGVQEASDMLANSSSTIIVAGGGIRNADASDELTEIAEKLNAPVITTRKGKGVLPEDHKLSAGVIRNASAELRDYISSANVALGVGTDFDALATKNWSVPISDQLIHITMHPDDIGRGYSPEISLIGDAKSILTAINENFSKMEDIGNSNGKEIVQSIRRNVKERLSGLVDVSEPPLTSASALTTIRNILPRSTIISTDVGGFRTWSFLPGIFEAYGPRKQILPGSWGTMGTGLPAAIGAQIANPKEHVVALVGDGGLLMYIHELHTAVQEELPLTVIVLNNNDYAIISEGATQEYKIRKKEFAWTKAPIDFTMLAHSLGVESFQTDTLTSIQNTLTQELKTDHPSLMEIPIDPQEPQVRNWWDDQ